MRKDAAGNVMSTVKVPLSYAPKRKYMERILENPDLYTDTKVAIKLPRMSFEIISINYDSARQLSKTNNYILSSAQNTRTKVNSPAPYDISFQLNIYAKSQDDALQVVEQIFPYFTPQYSLTIKPIDGYTTLKEDTPIILTGVGFTDDYEGALEDRRTIIYTLDFMMKINFYGPTGTGTIIREAIIDIYNMNAGLADSDIKMQTINVIPDPADAHPDSDYGFNTILLGPWDSA